eukprot:7644720-Lingulodinium_polyedra.AAC.1
MVQTGPSPPSQTSDAYFWANQVANAELLVLYLRCAKRLARAHGQEHVQSDLHSVPKSATLNIARCFVPSWPRGWARFRTPCTRHAFLARPS